MARLIPPVTVRRRLPYFEHPKPGKWHICKSNPNYAACGITMCEQLPWRTWETSTVDKVKAKDLCRDCWPYEADDTADLGPLFGDTQS